MIATTLQDAVLGFYEDMRAEGFPLSAKAQAMMIYLIVEANKNRERKSDGSWGFPLYVLPARQDLMDMLNISSRETLYKVRDELVSAGYLLYVSVDSSNATAYIPLPLRPADRRKIMAENSYRDKLIRLATVMLNSGF